MMQHGRALDSTLNVELVVSLKWLNIGHEPGLGLSRCWTRYKSGIRSWYGCLSVTVVAGYLWKKIMFLWWKYMRWQLR